MSKQTEALKLALEQTLEMLSDNREYIEANERAEYLAMYDKAIAGAEKALAEQPTPAAQEEPIYQCQDSTGKWTDQDKHSYDYNVQHARATVRVVYTSPQAQQEPVAQHRDLHSHMMVVAHRAADAVSSNGQKPTSQKKFVRAICTAIQADKNLLAKLAPQAHQEPVAWWDAKLGVFNEKHFDQLQPLCHCSQAQPAREWVGLTDEERDRIWSSYRVSFVAIGHIEAKLKEKNA